MTGAHFFYIIAFYWVWFVVAVQVRVQGLPLKVQGRILPEYFKANSVYLWWGNSGLLI